jgi:hypothetical protein
MSLTPYYISHIDIYVYRSIHVPIPVPTEIGRHMVCVCVFVARVSI